MEILKAKNEIELMDMELLKIRKKKKKIRTKISS